MPEAPAGGQPRTVLPSLAATTFPEAFRVSSRPPLIGLTGKSGREVQLG